MMTNINPWIITGITDSDGITGKWDFGVKYYKRRG